MIKRFFRFFQSRETSSSPGKRLPKTVVVQRGEHTLSRKKIDQDALKVLNRLNRFKHSAYLVGGGVRDLLLGREAKDFDVATSAHPNEIKRLFRNCRLIGKRFRLAHILFRGRKVIEVSTFRRHAGFGDNGDLLIKSDNTFGTAEEDARRRDFTINGLFYNISDFSVIDYVGGLKDLEARVIETIGDPNIRFLEDPIRILRAIRFASRLEFTIAPTVRKAIERHRKEIWKGAVPRILDELLRLLREGAASRSFQLLQELGMLEILLPRLAADFTRAELQVQILKNLETLDRKAKPSEGFSPALLVSVLYCPSFSSILREGSGEPDHNLMAGRLLESDLARLKFPKLQMERARQFLAAQYRLAGIGKKRVRPGQLIQKAYFADALTLFEITQPPSGQNRAITRRWRRLQQNPAPVTDKRRRRRRSPRDQASPAQNPSPESNAAGEPAEQPDSARKGP